jgi:hypothetical protein
MKPRVFISSTYYDLKHVRERIERFFEKYAYDAVLFESNNVTFEHDKPLDISCYNEVKTCQIMVLIVGGRYGSIVSGENQVEKKNNYDEYVSITRREFETAQKMRIPIFIFIDKNVYAEYQTFKTNLSLFDSSDLLKEKKFKFAHVDDHNVFRFINNIRGQAIKTFERVEDIEQYLNNQLAGFMYLYLQQLQENSKEEKVLDSVSELRSVTKQMNEMLGAMGRNLMEEDKVKEVLFNQNKILIDFFINQIKDNISFQNEIMDFSKEETEKVYYAFKETVFNYELLHEIELEQGHMNAWKKRDELELLLKNKLIEINPHLVSKDLNFYKLSNSYYKKIHPIIIEDKKLEELFKKQFIEDIELEITGLPF